MAIRWDSSINRTSEPTQFRSLPLLVRRPRCGRSAVAPSHCSNHFGTVFRVTAARLKSGTVRYVKCSDICGGSASAVAQVFKEYKWLTVVAIR